MKRLVFAVLAVFVLSACTDGDEAMRVLDTQGYTGIKITGYNLFACSQDDFYHTGFIATSPNGKRVEGTICSGLLFKGATVRFD